MCGITHFVYVEFRRLKIFRAILPTFIQHKSYSFPHFMPLLFCFSWMFSEMRCQEKVERNLAWCADCNPLLPSVGALCMLNLLYFASKEQNTKDLFMYRSNV